MNECNFLGFFVNKANKAVKIMLCHGLISSSYPNKNWVKKKYKSRFNDDVFTETQTKAKFNFNTT